MADLNVLRNEKNQYVNLKNVLLQVCNYLDKSKNSLELCSNIELYFNIDDVSGDNGIINSSRIIIINDYNLLSKQILSEIDIKIKNIGDAIIQEEQRLEAELRVKEEQRLEAERKAQEKATKLTKQQAISNNNFSSNNLKLNSNSTRTKSSIGKPNISKFNKSVGNNKKINLIK